MSDISPDVLEFAKVVAPESLVIDDFTFDVYDKVVRYDLKTIFYRYNEIKCKGFWFQGKQGVGKSVAMAMLSGLLYKKQIAEKLNKPQNEIYNYLKNNYKWLNEVALSRVDCWINWNYFSNIYQDYKQDKTVSKLVNAYNNCPVLYIDDFGSCAMADRGALELIYGVINHRLDYGRPIMVTSNIMMSEVKGMAGFDRLADKLKGGFYNEVQFRNCENLRRLDDFIGNTEYILSEEKEVRIS